MAARLNSVNADALETPDAFDEAIRSAAEHAMGNWVRVVGYDDYRHGPLASDRLDAVAGEVRVRVQHRTGLAWVLSTAGLNDVLSGVARDEIPDGFEQRSNHQFTGRLFRLDGWLAERIDSSVPSFVGLSAELSALGLTGLTDATPALGAKRAKLLHDAVIDESLAQRLVLLGVEEHEAGTWARVGPAKIVIDELTGLDPDALAEQIRMHHERDRSVAIHAVSRAETVTTALAFSISGIREGDRIEHGSVVPFDLDPLLANSGLCVIVQPGLVYERGDHYLEAVEKEDHSALHRVASFLEAGIAVGIGSDAPVASIDPWATIASATTRTTRSGRVLGASERVDAKTALDWYLADPGSPGGSLRRVAAGALADLCLLTLPLKQALAEPSAQHVRMTWINGRLVHS